MNLSTFRQIACSLLVLLLGFPVPGFTAPEGLPEARGPVEVVADRLDVDDVAQYMVFTGNAVATQDGVTIHGDRLTVKYQGENREIVQLIAEGHVRIVETTRVATGDKAIFYRQEDRMVLTGSPQVTEGDNFVRGEEITIFLNDRRSIVSGGSGGRVNAVFTPQKESKP